jgi:hypothetical protein
VRALSARRSYERQGSLDNDAIYFGDASRIGLEHDDGHPPETLSAVIRSTCSWDQGNRSGTLKLRARKT